MAVVKKINDDLWRTMEEPDIDPLMAQGLKSNPGFRDWWTCRFYPDVKLGKLLKVEPNDWRKEWTKQVGRWRETDLHVEFQDTRARRYAILTESKVVAPAGDQQPEDYSSYACWGCHNGKWVKAVTVLMAPEGYLKSNSSVRLYDQNVSYEEIEEAARRHGLDKLADYLHAGVMRHRYCLEPRNPDDTVSAFRMKYGDLLRDEHRDLYKTLSAGDKKRFDSSQTWFYYLPDGSKDQIVHKISNKSQEPRNDEDPQYLSLHAHGLMQQINDLPDLGCPGEWRATKAYAIKDVPLSRDAWMFFESFDADTARRVWSLLETLRERWMRFRNT